MNSGSLIGKKYRLTKPIGEGAMGVVWAAINELTSREVALKLILRSTPDTRVRLMREAQACGKLAHRNIIEVFDVGVTDTGDPFLIMPLLSGENLAQRLERQRRIEPVVAAKIARDVARALEAAHAASIIHRDLKPANIFLHEEAGTDGVVVKVLDFGVSKNLASTEAITTVAGGPVGSPAYMSPEQFRVQRDLDPRTDLWSLGAVLFEMLTGSRAFQGDATQVMHQVLTGAIPRVSSILWRADPKLDGLVARCLERSRDRRISSATELARELDEFLGTSDPSRGHAEVSARSSSPSFASPPGFASVSEPPSRAAAPAGNPFPLSPSVAGSLEMLDDDNVATVPVDVSVIAGFRRGPIPPAPPPPDAAAQAPSAGAYVPTLASPTAPSMIEPGLSSTTPLDPAFLAAAWHGGLQPGREAGGASGSSPPAVGGVLPGVGLGGTTRLTPEIPSRTPTWGHLPAVEAAPPAPVSAPRSGDASMTTGAAAVVQVPAGSASDAARLTSASDAARLASGSGSAPLADDRGAGKRLMLIVGAASAALVAGILIVVLPGGGGSGDGTTAEAGTSAPVTSSVPVLQPTSAPAPAPSPVSTVAAASSASAAAVPSVAPSGTLAPAGAVATAPGASTLGQAPKKESGLIFPEVPWEAPKAAPTSTAPKAAPTSTAPKPPPASTGPNCKLLPSRCKNKANPTGI